MKAMGIYRRNDNPYLAEEKWMTSGQQAIPWH
jgi:hypothetical protein